MRKNFKKIKVKVELGEPLTAEEKALYIVFSKKINMEVVN